MRAFIATRCASAAPPTSRSPSPWPDVASGHQASPLAADRGAKGSRTAIKPNRLAIVAHLQDTFAHASTQRHGDQRSKVVAGGGLWSAIQRRPTAHVERPCSSLRRMGCATGALVAAEMVDRLLTLGEVAAYLRCSKKTVSEHVRTGEIRYVAIGKGTKRPRPRFTPADVEDFIESTLR